MSSTAMLDVQGAVHAHGAIQSPGWWTEFQDALKGGKHCIGFVFNTADYVLTGDSLPRPLLPHVYNDFKLKGYDLVVTFSVSRGVEIFEQDADKESKFRRYTGLPLEKHDGPDRQPITPSVYLRGFHQLLAQDTLRVLLVLEYGHHIAPAVQPGMASVSSEDQLACVELMHSWSLDTFINTRTNNVVVAVMREGQYHDLLSEHWKIIRIDMPTEAEIARFYTLLSNLRERGRAEFAPLEPHASTEEAARASVGLRLRSIEEISRKAAARREPLTLPMIKDEKKREIQRMCGDVLEVMEADVTFDDLAGLDYVKNFYTQIERQVRRGFRNIPRALLLAGPPGCGKSFQVRALARELGWNCLQMRAVRSMWVGESERNLERVLNALQSNLPAILFMDEVDQMLGQRGQGGDAGTSERMLARLWEFMALEHLRGRLIFVAATNRPDLLDPATVDRFSTVIPVLQPTSEEFKAILPKVARQLGRAFAADVDVDAAARLLRRKELSTRQVIDVLAMAALKSDMTGSPGGPISAAALGDAARNFRSNHNPAQIEAITLEAVRMTTFAELLPWAASPANYEFPDSLRRVMDENFEVDMAALEMRLQELKRQLAISKMMG